MKHLRWIMFLVVTLVVLLYLLSVTVSVSLIRYGVEVHTGYYFDAGTLMLYLWVVNPFPQFLSVFALIMSFSDFLKSRLYRVFYIVYVCILPIAWLVGAGMVGAYY